MNRIEIAQSHLTRIDAYLLFGMDDIQIVIQPKGQTDNA